MVFAVEEDELQVGGRVGRQTFGQSQHRRHARGVIQRAGRARLGVKMGAQNQLVARGVGAAADNVGGAAGLGHTVQPQSDRGTLGHQQHCADVAPDRHRRQCEVTIFDDGRGVGGHGADSDDRPRPLPFEKLKNALVLWDGEERVVAWEERLGRQRAVQ